MKEIKVYSRKQIKYLYEREHLRKKNYSKKEQVSHLLTLASKFSLLFY